MPPKDKKRPTQSVSDRAHSAFMQKIADQELRERCFKMVLDASHTNAYAAAFPSEAMKKKNRKQPDHIATAKRIYNYIKTGK